MVNTHPTALSFPSLIFKICLWVLFWVHSWASFLVIFKYRLELKIAPELDQTIIKVSSKCEAHFFSIWSSSGAMSTHFINTFDVFGEASGSQKS